MGCETSTPSPSRPSLRHYFVILLLRHFLLQIPKSFRIRTYEKRVRNSFRIRTSKFIGLKVALLTSSRSEAMPQAIEVVGKAEQQRLADLHGQAAPGSARGEFAFGHRDDRFDDGALAVWFFRKGPIHLITDGAVGDTPTLGGDDAPRSQTLPNVLVVGLGIKLRIGQHQADGGPMSGRIQQPRQRPGVAPRPLTSPPRQQDLLVQIHHNQPLQAMTVAHRTMGMLFDAADKEGTDGLIGEPGAVDGYRSLRLAPTSPQPSHRFGQPAVD